ncbi:MAG: hypothetical protein AAF220_12485, partial [Pseudomonadota bacterium]
LLDYKAVDQDDAARLRRLKELAETNRDHHAALQFHADEQRAQRWQDGTGTLRSLLDLAFDVTSRHGRSVKRPVVGFGLILYGATILFTCLSVIVRPLTVPAPALNIAGQLWDRLTSAALYAISNAVPFIPSSVMGRQIGPDALLPPVETGTPQPYLETLIVLALGQGALSFIFLFLIALGLRNRFRL